ncbi:MAG: NAD-dependent epimerase/dehydratase family protein [Rikenellaceae bacterium]
MKILITGAAGFIGFYTVKYLAEMGHEVVGLDNINDYYAVELKYSRLAETGVEKEKILENTSSSRPVQSAKYSNYRFFKTDLADKLSLDKLFEHEHFDVVCNLAAQAGVRYSIENPYVYISSNILGFLNILEACRKYPVKHLVYASSSSVYGLNEKVPFSETDRVDTPVSLYAATKKSDELMAHAYSKLYNIPTTGVRFFTVYGPWGRPDMAPLLFMKAIIEGKPIQVFNYGNLYRDFTYIDDIIKGLAAIIEKAPTETRTPPSPLPSIPYKIYNIGNSKPIALMDFIVAIENVTGRKAIMNPVEMQPGDVYQTYADTSALESDFGYKPGTPIEKGINNLYEWVRNTSHKLLA